MNFPNAFEEAILQTEIVLQNQQTMRYLRDAEQVRADTRVLQAAISANITLSLANAEAYKQKALKHAQANATIIAAKNEYNALFNLKVNIKTTFFINWKKKTCKIENIGFC